MLRREKQDDDIDMYTAKMTWPKQELMTIPSSHIQLEYHYVIWKGGANENKK